MSKHLPARVRLRRWMQLTPCPSCGRPWTADGIAGILHVSPSAVRKWLCGLRVPSEEHRGTIEAVTRRWGKPEDAVTAEEWEE